MHRYRAELRLVTRATTAAVLSFVIAEWFGLPQSYWAVMTALIIVQLSLGGTIASGMDRFAGTLAGGVLAGAAAFAGKLLDVHMLVLLVLSARVTSVEQAGGMCGFLGFPRILKGMAIRRGYPTPWRLSTI